MDKAVKVRFLVILLFLILTHFSVSAQDNVRLNVRLHPVQILTIDPICQDKIPMGQTNDYTDLILKHTNRFTVYSTSGFQVKVSNGVNHGEMVPPKHMTILASSKSNSSLPDIQENIIFLERRLSGENQSIITSGRGGSNKQFDVNYKVTIPPKEDTTYSGLNGTDPNSPDYAYNILYTIISQ